MSDTEDKSSETGEDEELNKLEHIIHLHRQVFKGPEAVELLEFLAVDCHFSDGTFCSDPHEMYFREGERSVFNRIIEKLDLPLVNIRNILENSRDTYSGSKD